jgi:hypothetical protein
LVLDRLRLEGKIGTLMETLERLETVPTEQSRRISDAHKTESDDGKPAIADVVSINVAVPRDLHRRFRAQAVMLDLNMTDAIADAIERWLT